MTAETLLDRLSKVRKTGADSWSACCPSHQDKTPSLAIRELPDGRVLLHCFAGCDTGAVLAAVGLEFADLYPPKPTGDCPPERRPFSAADVLKALAFETSVVCAAAFELMKVAELALSPDEVQRLALAHSRIQSALSLIGTRRHG